MMPPREAQPVAAPADVAHFDALHRRSDDPWKVRSRWYERRKRDLLLAMLPRERYGLVFEPGCSVGGNTRALALRCDRLVACDSSTAALERARAALDEDASAADGPAAAPPRARIEFRNWALPRQWPDAPIDLAVVAELAYYLPPADYRDFLAQLPAHLAPDGQLAMCHWRGTVPDAAGGGGDAVHALARDAFGRAGLARVAQYRDEDFRIDLWQRGGESSVARREGSA
jgi:SAM-dependent methyltransferase